jgi:hypothetical protein
MKLALCVSQYRSDSLVYRGIRTSPERYLGNWLSDLEQRI